MKFNAFVTIKLKEGIIDPEGLNTKKALDLLGFSNVSNVKTLKVFEITLDAPDKKSALDKIDEMCVKLLTNPVVNDYAVKFE